MYLELVLKFQIEVRFDSLNVDTEAYVESRALPTLLNFTINFFEVIFSNLGLIDSTLPGLTTFDHVMSILENSSRTFSLFSLGVVELFSYNSRYKETIFNSS